MNTMKVFCLAATILATPSFLYAQATNNTKTVPYGDNPNIFKVLAYKTGEKIQNTAEKVGTATEKGIQKIKPKVDETWDNTKTYTTEQAEIAKENTRKGIDTAIKKVNETKDSVIGTSGGNVPIQHNSLSQNSGLANTTTPVTAPLVSTPTKNAVAVSKITQAAAPINNNSSKQNITQDEISADIPH
ncbi:hypothetical protein [Acinetobacter silvestris]|uniref:Uncharacterized protein n=1 Tax=Acinetobacter silvestris TaxID=1977882 RepID=A0A1Y3CMQ7_9GAMM|nr:hypothetical protein [Acinetobacter silvestris]OTG67114.1 hypothetical protein B9T28_00245 [Acinetobacter silvestris]